VAPRALVCSSAMTRRRKLVLSAVAALGVASVLALPGVHWRLIGWWRSEPFYQGRPASFYAARIRADFEPQPVNGFLFPRYPALLGRWGWQYAPQWLYLWAWGDDDNWRRPAADGRRVLMALLAEADWRVKVYAMVRLDAERPEDAAEPPERRAARTVQALTLLLDDPHPLVRSQAAFQLGDFGPPMACPAVPKLLNLCGDRTDGLIALTVEEWATRAILRIDPDALKDAGRP
jgi:hypothetical protein